MDLKCSGVVWLSDRNAYLVLLCCGRDCSFLVHDWTGCENVYARLKSKQTDLIFCCDDLCLNPKSDVPNTSVNFFSFVPSFLLSLVAFCEPPALCSVRYILERPIRVLLVCTHLDMAKEYDRKEISSTRVKRSARVCMSGL